MNDLLQVAVDAHGGLSRWNQLKRGQGNLSITGAIWQNEGQARRPRRRKCRSRAA
jgi:hypothetical protein